MDMTQKASEFDPHPVVPQPVREGPLAALLEWQAKLQAARRVRDNRQRADLAHTQTGGDDEDA
jgi:hypothetical protein